MSFCRTIMSSRDTARSCSPNQLILNCSHLNCRSHILPCVVQIFDVDAAVARITMFLDYLKEIPAALDFIRGLSTWRWMTSLSASTCTPVIEDKVKGGYFKWKFPVLNLYFLVSDDNVTQSRISSNVNPQSCFDIGKGPGRVWALANQYPLSLATSTFSISMIW